MSREISFRAWTGKQMMYQDQQYLGSFLRRVVMQVMLDHDMDAPKEHESYLPKGSKIDDYLMQLVCRFESGRKVYEGDIVYCADYDVRGVVTWSKTGNGFIILAQDKTGAYVLHDLWEVVGSIHENPDLLTA